MGKTDVFAGLVQGNKTVFSCVFNQGLIDFFRVAENNNRLFVFFLYSLCKLYRVVVEGRLQNNTVKGEDGSEKRIVEIDAFAIEKMAGSSTNVASSAPKSPDSLVQFGQDDFSDDLIGEDEIPF